MLSRSEGVSGLSPGPLPIFASRSLDPTSPTSPAPSRLPRRDLVGAV
jgi:hypothetical protein